MRRIIWTTLCVLVLAGTLSSQALAATYTATGRIVDVSGNPRPNWTVAVSYHTSPFGGITVHVTTNSNGAFSDSKDLVGVDYIIVTPDHGESKTLNTPHSGAYDFGDMVGGNCRNCPLPAEGPI